MTAEPPFDGVPDSPGLWEKFTPSEKLAYGVGYRRGKAEAALPVPALDVERDWSVQPGEVLREWLQEHAITQAELSRRMGVSPPEVSKVVNGHDRITPRMALALERACGINADVLARMQVDHDLAALREGETRHE